MFRISLLAMLGAIAALASTPAQGQSRQLDPVDEWSVEQEDEYCGLSRTFGSAAAPVTLFIYSYGPIGGYRITLEGENLPRNSNKARIGSVAFGDHADLQEINIIVGRRGDSGTINFLSYRADPGFRFGYIWSGEREVPLGMGFDPGATRLTFDTAEMDPVTLLLGPLDDALAQLRSCESALLESWDYDLPTEEPATPAAIDNGWDVVRAIRRPPAMLINRSSQIVQVRLVIDEAGEVEDCVLQSPNWRARDARGVCRAFADLGEYSPARNSEGEPVPSLLRGYYLMLVYD
jgi:hypothetical protein